MRSRRMGRWSYGSVPRSCARLFHNACPVKPYVRPGCRASTARRWSGARRAREGGGRAGGASGRAQAFRLGQFPENRENNREFSKTWPCGDPDCGLTPAFRHRDRKFPARGTGNLRRPSRENFAPSREFGRSRSRRGRPMEDARPCTNKGGEPPPLRRWRPHGPASPRPPGWIIAAGRPINATQRSRGPRGLQPAPHPTYIRSRWGIVQR